MDTVKKDFPYSRILNRLSLLRWTFLLYLLSMCDRINLADSAPLPIINLESFTSSYGIVFDGANPDDYSGASVAAAGDVDGDGLMDFLIAAPGISPLQLLHACQKSPIQAILLKKMNTTFISTTHHALTYSGDFPLKPDHGLSHDMIIRNCENDIKNKEDYPINGQALLYSVKVRFFHAITEETSRASSHNIIHQNQHTLKSP